MQTQQKTLPKWILVVSGLFALMEIGVSISMCLSPESVLENVDLTAKGVTYLVNMWSVRQFALGFTFGFATLKKSAPMLTLAYIFFLVMFIGDLLIGINQKEISMILSVLVMCIVAGVMLFFIDKNQ